MPVSHYEIKSMFSGKVLVVIMSLRILSAIHDSKHITDFPVRIDSHLYPSYVLMV